MIIGHEHRYVFVQFPHSGSTAVGSELIENYGGEEILSKHAYYRTFLEQASEDEKSYFAFSTIRDPLDVTVTKYFRYRTNRNRRYTDPRMLGKRRGPGNRIDQTLHRAASTSEFSDYFLRYYRLPYNSWACLDHHRLDAVMRYDRLREDFAGVIATLGLELVRDLPQVNKTGGKQAAYSTYYSPAAIERARRVFGPYMEEWGFAFPPEWGPLEVTDADRRRYRAATVALKAYWLYARPRMWRTIEQQPARTDPVPERRAETEDESRPYPLEAS